jgi:hypothetical protein
MDVNQSKALTQADYDLKIKNTPQMVETTGKAGREEAARNIGFGLQGFNDPASVVYGGQIEDLGEKNAALTAQRKATSDPKEKRRIQAQIDANNKRITGLRKSDPVGDLRKAFAPQFAQRDRIVGDLNKARGATVAYDRMQKALQRGLGAQQVGQRQGTLSRAAAAGIGQVADVRAGQVGAGALGGTLMEQAMRKAQSDGTLSAEASRDAVQSARSGMAARGMATGSAGLAAEMLNRDRFSRQRQFEDLAFAQGVQTQDLGRQFQNVGNTMQADLANQGTQLTREQIISQNMQGANLANMQAANNMSQFNTGLASETDRFNAMQRTDAGRFNLGLLQTSAQAADQERARSLGLGQSAYNFALQTDPKMMLAGLGSPYANFTPQALGLMGNQNVQPIYSGGSAGTYGQNMAMFGSLMNAGGQLGSAAIMASDRRIKKDIKQVGKDGVLGLKTYEYRYKGEPKDAPKRVGFMAQEVREVLPDAVEEIDYEGKKRLAIKPKVIGQALAQALTAQQDAMFSEGYTV